MEEKIFADDELSMLTPQPYWTREDLLQCNGMFYFKDIADLLGISSEVIKKRVEGLTPLESWERMGVRMVWSHWVIRMKVFRPYYRSELEPRYREVQEEWDCNDIIAQKGIYKLSDVGKRTPFSLGQLRHQAKIAGREIGAWKDKDLNVYLVEMSVFGPWLKEIWKNGFPKRERGDRGS